MELSRRSALAVLGGAFGSALAIPAYGQNYPSRSIRYIVPFAAGGGADAMGRLIAPRAGAVIGQPFVVDNQSGANGSVGAEIVAKAAPDGYTILEPAANIVMGISLMKSVPFNLVTDFAPVTVLAKTPLILALNPQVPAKTVKELVALSKSQPGKLNFGSDQGGPMRLGMELLKVDTGSDMTNIPYNGTAPAMLAALSGDVAAVMAPAPAALPYVKSGKLRGIAVSGTDRLALIPELPTVAEAVPGFAVEQWYGILAPAATPAAIVNALNAAFVKAIRSPEIKDQLRNEILIPVGSSPQGFATYLNDEVAKWSKVVKSAGIPVS